MKFDSLMKRLTEAPVSEIGLHGDWESEKLHRFDRPSMRALKKEGYLEKVKSNIKLLFFNPTFFIRSFFYLFLSIFYIFVELFLKHPVNFFPCMAFAPVFEVNLSGYNLLKQFLFQVMI